MFVAQKKPNGWTLFFAFGEIACGLWALVGVTCLCAGMVLADVPERVSTRLNRGDREGA